MYLFCRLHTGTIIQPVGSWRQDGNLVVLSLIDAGAKKKKKAIRGAGALQNVNRDKKNWCGWFSLSSAPTPGVQRTAGIAWFIRRFA